VLILGDYDYGRPERVYADLSRLFLQDGLQVLTVVHGGALTGPDRMARTFAEEWQPWCVFFGRDVVQEVHQAAWAAFQLEAGGIRDWAMIATQPDLCLAYPGPSGRSRGLLDEARQVMEVWDRSG
jgi:hypothetical protein